MPKDPLISLLIFSGIIFLVILAIIIWNLIEGKTSKKTALKDLLSFAHAYIFYLVIIAAVAIVFTIFIGFFR